MSSFEFLQQFTTEVDQCTTAAALASVGIDTMRRVFGTTIAVFTLKNPSKYDLELTGKPLRHLGSQQTSSSSTSSGLQTDGDPIDTSQDGNHDIINEPTN